MIAHDSAGGRRAGGGGTAGRRGWSERPRLVWRRAGASQYRPWGRGRWRPDGGAAEAAAVAARPTRPASEADENPSRAPRKRRTAGLACAISHTRPGTAAGHPRGTCRRRGAGRPRRPPRPPLRRGREAGTAASRRRPGMAWRERRAPARLRHRRGASLGPVSTARRALLRLVRTGGARRLGGCATSRARAVDLAAQASAKRTWPAIPAPFGPGGGDLRPPYRRPGPWCRYVDGLPSARRSSDQRRIETFSGPSSLHSVGPSGRRAGLGARSST